MNSSQFATVQHQPVNMHRKEIDKEKLELFLQEQRANILNTYTSIAPINRTDAETAMTRVYSVLKRPVPKFKWVDNPWMIAQTALADDNRGNSILLSKTEEKVGHRVRMALEDCLSADDFNEFFQLLWNNLPARQVRALAAHVEAERLVERDLDIDSFEQTQTIRHFLFPSQQRFTRSSSWNLEIEWAIDTLIRLGLARSARDCFKVKINREDNDELDCFFTMSSSVHAYKCFDNLCVMSDKPIELHIDAEWRLHKSDGAAVRYKGRPGIYSWHGMRVPEQIIMEKPTLQTIDCESNVAVRRVLIERYGVQNYLLDSGAEIRHHDDYGTLYITELHNDENIAMVHVTNATAEPNGEFRNYFLRVPPTMSTAREAVAWTFGLTSEEYDPQCES